MELAFVPSFLTAIVASVVVGFVWLLGSNQRPKTFPPGPPTFPILGNIHQLPVEHSYLKFSEWSKQYGDIIGLKVGPQNMVVLHSPEVIRELFVNRGTIYSGRPSLYIFKHYIFPGLDHVLFMGNGPSLRRWRTAVKRLTGPAGLKDVFPIQDTVAANLITALREGKSPPSRIFELWSLTTSMAGVWGHAGIERAPQIIDRYVEVQHDLLQLVDPSQTPPVDLIPLLRYVPYAGWKRKARHVGKTLGDINLNLLSDVKRQLSQTPEPDNTHRLGLIGSIYRDQQSPQEDSDNTAQEFSDSYLTTMAQVLMDAGTDTTTSAAMSCVLALATHPEVFKKLRDEIDKICGGESPPQSGDIGRLPYLNACISETLRWRPPACMLLPHSNERADTFQGYYFPKDTVFMANAWSVYHDPRYFVDPETFNPGRFLGGQVESVLSPFGVGRRMCPGDQFATASLRLAISKVVWAFDLVIDGPPPDLSVETGYKNGIIIAPNDLPVKFVPRDRE